MMEFYVEVYEHGYYTLYCIESRNRLNHFKSLNSLSSYLLNTIIALTEILRKWNVWSC